MNAPRTKFQNGAWLFALASGLCTVATSAAADQQAPQQVQVAQHQADAGQAQVLTSANVQVMVLHATNSDAGASIDPAIGKLPALQQPPFSSFNTYKLLSRTPLLVSKPTPATTKLPNDRVLQITLREVLQGGRFKIDTSINQPGGNTSFLPLLSVTTPAGEPFFVAGQSYKGGMLVIGITVLK
jgi:hypothetical protein